MKQLKVTKYEELNVFAAKLAENGFTIISSYDENKPSFNSYFNFYKDGYFGYCQCDRFQFSLSTVNKPCHEHGTGMRVYDTWDKMTVAGALKVLEYSRQRIAMYKDVKNYTLEEFTDNEFTRKGIVKHEIVKI